MNIVCHRAQYSPREEVLVLVAGATPGTRAPLVVRHLGEVIVHRQVVLDGPDTELSLGGFENGGYEVELGSLVTAFDVSAAPHRFPRYGFISRFAAADAGRREASDQLLRYRVTHVHFYDWMYRHHEFLPPSDQFQDAMGRWVDLAVVRERIAYCHERGQKAVAYGAVYGAEEEYIASRPEQRLYRADGTPLVFIGLISFCNIAPGNAWNETIVEQYRQTVTQLDFDGIHMDQYGYPKVAFDAEGRPVDLEVSFRSLINTTKSTLREVRPDNVVFFNAVGDWPTATVAGAETDAQYIEVWDPHSTYGHLMALVRKAKALAPQKAVILAAYLHCFLEDVPEAQKIWGALTAQAHIGAAGGTHLLWGEHCGALAEGYYVNHGTYRADWEPLLRTYAEFPVKYRDWLQAEADDVSWDRVGGPNREVLVDGWVLTPDGSVPGLTVSVRRLPGTLVVQFLHPRPLAAPLWNAPALEPVTVTDLKVQVMIDGRPRRVSLASPDFDEGRLFDLDFTETHLEEGVAVEFLLPRLKLWSMVVIRSQSRPN